MTLLSYARTVAPLRRLKWVSTLVGSVAGVMVLGIVMHWAAGGDGYHWSALPVAIGVAATALVARQAIALRLDDKRPGS